METICLLNVDFVKGVPLHDHDAAFLVAGLDLRGRQLSQGVLLPCKLQLKLRPKMGMKNQSGSFVREGKLFSTNNI